MSMMETDDGDETLQDTERGSQSSCESPRRGRALVDRRAFVGSG
jgi:hypothetical protein